MVLLMEITEEMEVASVFLRDAVPCGVVREAIIYQECKSESTAHAFLRVCAPEISIQDGRVHADSVLNFTLLIGTRLIKKHVNCIIEKKIN